MMRVKSVGTKCTGDWAEEIAEASRLPFLYSNSTFRSAEPLGLSAVCLRAATSVYALQFYPEFRACQVRLESNVQKTGDGAQPPAFPLQGVHRPWHPARRRQAPSHPLGPHAPRATAAHTPKYLAHPLAQSGPSKCSASWRGHSSARCCSEAQSQRRTVCP